MNIKTKYGTLYDCYNIDYYNHKILSECICQKKSPLIINNMHFLPYYTDNERRKLSSSVRFYPTGNIKSIYLENRTLINTPCGTFSAELITFYPDGKLCRVFPLNGKVSEYWSEENEKKLIECMSFSLSVGKFIARPMCLHFYENGNLKSLTLQSNEFIAINTPVGKLKIKCGFSLYESGELRSAEPSSPQKILTPIGILSAFDPESVNLSADKCSLTFTENGDIASLKTIDSISITSNEGNLYTIDPIKKPHPLNENAMLTLPLTIAFFPKNITITRSSTEKFSFQLDMCHFTIK